MDSVVVQSCQHKQAIYYLLTCQVSQKAFQGATLRTDCCISYAGVDHLNWFITQQESYGSKKTNQFYLAQAVVHSSPLKTIGTKACI